MEDTVICNIDSIGYERAWDEYGVTIDGEGTFLIADSKYVGLSFTDYKALYGNALLDGDERTLLRVRLDPVEHNITCMLPRNQGENRFYKVTVGINSKDNLRGLRITIFLYQPGIK